MSTECSQSYFKFTHLRDRSRRQRRLGPLRVCSRRCLGESYVRTVEPRVVDNPDAKRYELWLGDELAGEIRYSLRDDGKLVLIHTEIDPGHKGEGLGNVLVKGGLDDLHERGIEYVVVCPFVRAYLRRHPEDA
jgi:predicted GNAT family acetyltransferase